MLEQKQVESSSKGKKAKNSKTAEKKEYVNAPLEIVKRDGRKVSFEIKRIENAIFRCFRSLDRPEQKAEKKAHELANQVLNIVSAKYDVPTVENIQDIVEMVLQASEEFDAAKRYILYRAEHAKMRQERPVPDEVKEAFKESDIYFQTQLKKFKFYEKY